jgi:predicted phosphate transport protein (TIGR00153 family)
MVLRLMPREERFFTLLEEAAGNIVVGATLIHRLFAEWKDVPDLAEKIKEVEEKGDQLTHDIARLLNATFVTPIDREDILAMASRLDDIIDRVEAAAARVVLFRISSPTERSRAITRTLCLACDQVASALVHFRSKKFALVAHACVEINRLENAGDEDLRLALEELFDGSHEALEVMKWKEIYETLEEAIDRCEDVADVLEAVALKNS